MVRQKQRSLVLTKIFIFFTVIFAFQFHFFHDLQRKVDPDQIVLALDELKKDSPLPVRHGGENDENNEKGSDAGNDDDSNSEGGDDESGNGDDDGEEGAGDGDDDENNGEEIDGNGDDDDDDNGGGNDGKDGDGDGDGDGDDDDGSINDQDDHRDDRDEEGKDAENGGNNNNNKDDDDSKGEDDSEGGDVTDGKGRDDDNESVENDDDDDNDDGDGDGDGDDDVNDQDDHKDEKNEEGKAAKNGDNNDNNNKNDGGFKGGDDSGGNKEDKNRYEKTNNGGNDGGNDDDDDDEEERNADDINNNDDDQDNKYDDKVENSDGNNIQIIHQGEKEKGKVKSAAEPSHEPEFPSLQCEQYGGPKDDISSEMVYWMDIPSDAAYRNPFQKFHANEEEEKFVTFEPDIGGWNNMRMSMETVVTLAISMGRTIVLPPEHGIYLMQKTKKQQKNQFTFRDFYNLDAIQSEHIGLKFIPMTEFLERVAMSGKLKDMQTGQVSYPPANRTDWNKERNVRSLWEYLRTSTYDETCNPFSGIAFFPSKAYLSPTKKQGIEQLFRAQVGTNWKTFDDNPVAVDAPVAERLREHMGGRDKLCLYDETKQQAVDVHHRADKNTRFLAPFSTFAFFEDWRQGTWTKRFIRDHIRYSDEIVCAASRVVEAIRKIAKERDPINNPAGSFDTLHVRRNDFKAQYKDVVRSCEELYENSKDRLKPNSTIFIATDEYNRTFFHPFQKNYRVLFLSDFQHLVKDTNTNYFGFIDQLVASRGSIFYGTYFSTFTAYINRMRGYYSARDRLEGYEKGELQSYHLYPRDKQFIMTKYFAINQAFWSKEFPVGWRDIDKGIGELPQNR